MIKREMLAEREFSAVGKTNGTADVGCFSKVTVREMFPIEADVNSLCVLSLNVST